ncbi:MAG: hypothetical protein MUF54_01860 [Polyangiaceae bacterium]|jgi:hypothetical protein|nr:hypothetical protein [Polyangiaceae bacterium]
MARWVESIVSALAVTAIAFACGCGSDDESPGETGGTTEPDSGGTTEPDSGGTTEPDSGSGEPQRGDPNTISGTVRYEGSGTGLAIVVALYKSLPPGGPPDAFGRVKAPTFPMDYLIEDVDPGDYYVYAYIDMEPANPAMPGEEDPEYVATESVSVSNEKGGIHDFTIPVK